MNFLFHMLWCRNQKHLPSYASCGESSAGTALGQKVAPCPRRRALAFLQSGHYSIAIEWPVSRMVHKPITGKERKMLREWDAKPKFRELIQPTCQGQAQNDSLLLTDTEAKTVDSLTFSLIFAWSLQRKMQQRNTSENHVVFTSDCGHINAPCDTLRAIDHHEREGSLEYRLVKKWSSMCAWNMVVLIHLAAVCLFSTLTAHVLDVMTACSVIPVLQNIWRRTSCSLQHPSPSEPAHFCYESDSLWKLFDLIGMQVQEGHNVNCLAITRKL